MHLDLILLISSLGALATGLGLIYLVYRNTDKDYMYYYLIAGLNLIYAAPALLILSLVVLLINIFEG